MTNGPSRVYDSRTSPRPGVGFPSCRTDLCRLPPNRADPHGYYAEIGVPPWATPDEIRRAVRKLYRRLHPDTGQEPDPARLQRVKLVADVLLDPQERRRYDSTPPGKRLLDKVYRSELSALDLTGIDPEVVERMLNPNEGEPPRRPRSRAWDYLAVDALPGDAVRAQMWYAALTAAAPLAGYRRRIKVLIHDGPAFFHEDTAVMAIPRSWRPSTALAFGLFTVAAGVSRVTSVGAQV